MNNDKVVHIKSFSTQVNFIIPPNINLNDLGPYIEVPLK